MQHFEISEVRENEADKWNAFVLNNPHETVFQTYEMLRVYEESKTAEVLLLGARNRDNEFTSGMLACIRKERGGILEPLSTRSTIWGSPLYSSNMDFGGLPQLLEEYKERVAKKVIFTEIRSLSFDLSPIRSVMTSSGFKCYEHLNFLVDLTQPREQLWSRLEKSRRWGVRRGRERGVRVQEVTEEEDVLECCRLLNETYARVALPLAHRLGQSFLAKAFVILCQKNLAHFLAAKLKDRIVAVVFNLLYRDRIYCWQHGSDLAYNQYHPNEVLLWESIMWGKDHGYRIFDFGGAGTPDEAWGVRDFKSKYRGKLVKFETFRLIHSPIRYAVAKRGFALYRRSFLG